MYKGERFNSISHMIGAVLALAGLVILVVISSLEGDPWKIVSSSIYGATLFILYLSSSIYHSHGGTKKKFFLIIDYCSIYLLIAGSYTPFTLVTLRGGWGWSLFGVVWGLAVTGIILDCVYRKGRRIIPLAIYIIMGWLILIAIKPLLDTFPMNGFWGLLAGGLCYTGGVFFYVFDHKAHYFHGIWHLFVLAGSTCHYFTILFYVI